jgi:sulfonate transport system permease protein
MSTNERWSTLLARYPVAAGLVVTSLLVLLWQMSWSLGWARPQSSSPPSGIVAEIADLARNGALLQQGARTIGVTVASWTFAVSIGLCLGLLVGMSRTVRRFTFSSIEFMRCLPGITFVPIILLIVGFSVKGELILGTIGSIWPVLIFTIAGVRSVPHSYWEMARSLQMSRRDTLVKVVAPASAASAFVGMRISLGVSMLLVIIMEMVGTSAGLGGGLVFEKGAVNVEGMFAYLFVIGGSAVALNMALQAAGRHVPWLLRG